MQAFHLSIFKGERGSANPDTEPRNYTKVEVYRFSASGSFFVALHRLSMCSFSAIDFTESTKRVMKSHVVDSEVFFENRIT